MQEIGAGILIVQIVRMFIAVTLINQVNYHPYILIQLIYL